MWSPRQRIVVPIDFSEQARSAVAVAQDMAAQSGPNETSEVLGVHVLPDLSPAEPGKLWNTVGPASRIEHATQALQEWLEEGKQKLDHVDVAIGDPGAEICRIATERKADLIVLPSHGRTGLQRLLIGSVAERVVRLAPCPVLVLRHFAGPSGEPSTET